MRATGIEAVRDAEAEAASKPSRAQRRVKQRVWLLAGLVVALVGLAWFVVPKAEETASKDGRARPMSPSELTAALSEAGARASPAAQLLEPNAAIEAFAQAVPEGGGPRELAAALVKAVRARAQAQAFVPWAMGEPRLTEPMSAAQVLAALEQDGARAQLYPLEVAALTTVALRTRGVWAMLTELRDYDDLKAPLDPSGYLGYFGVAVFDEGESDAEPTVFDPYGGRSLPAAVDHAVLEDSVAVGAALSLRAVFELGLANDPKQGLTSSSKALELAGRLPSARTAHGVIMLAGQLIEQGLAEFQAALSLRRDAARLHNMATLMLATREVERAEKHLDEALSLSPEYALALATRGTLSMLKGDLDKAQADLERAEQLSPSAPGVQWGLSELALRSGRKQEALTRAERAFDARKTVDAHLRYAALLQQAGERDKLREVVASALESVPAGQQGQLRAVLEGALGADAVPGAGDGEPAGMDSLPDLSLGSPGDLGLSEPGKLRLRDPAQGMKLNLGEP